MDEATYYNKASAEEVDSLYDLALSANLEDASYYFESDEEEAEIL